MDSLNLTGMSVRDSGHVFISYVREDAELVDRIQTVIEAAGIPVWRDTQDLWPGEDWKIKIREAITNNTLVFIACFSDKSVSKERTYQREEILLAAEQLRQRAPEQAWFIPVRLTDCALPQYDLGVGRTLDSLQRVDLLGDRWDERVARLISGVIRILRPVPATSEDSSTRDTDIAQKAKGLLLDERRRIDLEELVRSAVNETYEVLTDPSEFPLRSDRLTNDAAGLRFLMERANRYWEDIAQPRDALIVGCAWGQEQHRILWTKALERVANIVTPESGQTALLEMRRFPTTVLLYAGGIAAVHRENYSMLKAIAIDAQFRADPHPVPVVGVGHVWLPFSQTELTAHLLAFEASGEDITDELIDSLETGRRGKRHTPVSDFLHDKLKEPASIVIDDDIDYTTTFDRLEVLLAALASDAKAKTEGTEAHVWGPWFGSFTWRSKYSSRGPEQQIYDEFLEARDQWMPIRAGLFGGEVERADAALQAVIQGASQIRQRQ